MCNCIQQMDELLKDKNLEVNSTLPLFGKPSKVVSYLVFVDESKKKRGEKAPMIDFHYCPLCGAKYENTAESDTLRPDSGPLKAEPSVGGK